VFDLSLYRFFHFSLFSFIDSSDKGFNIGAWVWFIVIHVSLDSHHFG
jgi:hypothetical protein